LGKRIGAKPGGSDMGKAKGGVKIWGTTFTFTPDNKQRVGFPGLINKW